MSEKKETANEFTQEELVKLASELDKTVAKPKKEKVALTVGVYVAQVNKTYLFKGNRDNTIFLNFGFQIRGFLSQNEMGHDEVVPREFGYHAKGYSLSKDFCVNMLMDLYRDLDVRRTDGEGIVYGGDLLRSRGIPKGTWVVLKVKKGRDDEAFISSVYAPSKTLLMNIKSVFAEENDTNDNQEEEFDNGDIETGNPPF